MDLYAWEQTVPASITGDALWRMQVYRLALFAADTGWSDVTLLFGDRRTQSLADQLYRALGSVSANIAEGYSHGTGRDRARFFEFALGSARESRDWYYKARHLLPEAVEQSRLDQLTKIIRLLLTIIPAERKQRLREEAASYDTETNDHNQ